jgi:hypothetical protein
MPTAESGRWIGPESIWCQFWCQFIPSLVSFRRVYSQLITGRIC